MASVFGQLVAVMVAAAAVLVGSLLGGGPLEATLDGASVFALVGFAICFCRVVVAQTHTLYNRLGDIIILGIMMMF